MMDISDIWEREPSDDVLSVILPCPGDECEWFMVSIEGR